jgi:uncharacterized membrane protein
MTSTSDSPAAEPHLETEVTHSSRVNVGPLQRLGSVVAGGVLVMGGLTHRSAAGYFAAAVGGALLARGATGHCPALSQLGVDMAHDDDDPTESSEP